MLLSPPRPLHRPQPSRMGLASGQPSVVRLFNLPKVIIDILQLRIFLSHALTDVLEPYQLLAAPQGRDSSP
jgi:hypothetical protein